MAGASLMSVMLKLSITAVLLSARVILTFTPSGGPGRGRERGESRVREGERGDERIICYFENQLLQN